MTDVSWTGSMPAIYQDALGPAIFEPFGPVLATAVSDTGASSVLELAAGTGIATAHLVRGPAAVTATDLNPAMVEWGRLHVPEAEWQVADAQRLPFSDGSYDAVACQFGAMFFRDRIGAYAEAARVLRPGRNMFFTVWDEVNASPFPTAMVQSLQAVLGDDAPTFIQRVPHGYHDPDQIRRDVEAGGLQVLSIDRVVGIGHAPDARAVATGFAKGTPLRFALVELGGDLDELARRLGDEMVQRLGEGPVEADNVAWLVRGVRD
jgi:SAM-dependent methyltransferase